MLSLSKYDKKTKKYICVKKAMHLKDRTIFDFMIRLLNNESEIAKSSLLVVPELEAKEYNNTNGKMIQVEFDFVKMLLRDNCVKGYTLSFYLKNISYLFLLTHNFQSHFLLYKKKYNSENTYII